MRRYAMVMVAALATGLWGCQSGETRKGELRCAKPSTPRSVVAQVVDVKLLKLGEGCTFDKTLRLPDVVGRRCTWRILVGPNPDGGPVRICYTNPEPNILVENGWAYVAVQSDSSSSTAPAPEPGSGWGQARTTRVMGTAEGTRFIVQEQAGVHRVILLSGPTDKVRVVLDGKNNAAQNLQVARTYFEVRPPDTALPKPQTITDASSAVGQLVDYVESVAKIAGVK